MVRLVRETERTHEETRTESTSDAADRDVQPDRTELTLSHLGSQCRKCLGLTGFRSASSLVRADARVWNRITYRVMVMNLVDAVDGEHLDSLIELHRAWRRIEL